MVVQLVPMRDRRIDTEVGGYRLVEPIGEGGTSVVYRAEHVRLGRAAALKLLTPALGEADFRERFLRESRLAASLDHPSIVPVYDAGEADDVLYIAMQHIDGSDLKALLVAEGRLPVRRALRSLAGRLGARRRARARARAPRRQAGEHPRRRETTARSSPTSASSKSSRRSARRVPAASSARSTIARLSKSRASDSTRAQTSLRARVCVLRVPCRHVAVPPLV